MVFNFEPCTRTAWTCGINLYATVTVLGLLQKFGGVKLPGGLDVLDNWWIIGVAGGLIPDRVFRGQDPLRRQRLGCGPHIHTCSGRSGCRVCGSYDIDPAVVIPAALIGGGLRIFIARHQSGCSRRRKSVTRTGLKLGTVAGRGRHCLRRQLLAVFAPVLIAIVLVVFLIFFFWFFPKVYRAIRRLFNAIAAFFRGESFAEVARKAG